MRNYTLSYIHHIHYYQNMINDAIDFVTRSIQTMNHERTYSTLKTISVKKLINSTSKLN